MSAQLVAEGGAPLQDRGGCLTPAGLGVLRSAEAGRAPTALATHLAGCPRCQARALAFDAPRGKRARATSRPVWPSLPRTLLLATLLVAAIVAMLATLRRLAG